MHFLHVLLPSGEIQHVVSIFDQKGALCFCMDNIYGFVKTATFPFCTVFKFTSPAESPAALAADAVRSRGVMHLQIPCQIPYPARRQAATHDFDHSHIVYVECLAVFWHNRWSSLRLFLRECLPTHTVLMLWGDGTRKRRFRLRGWKLAG